MRSTVEIVLAVEAGDPATEQELRAVCLVLDDVRAMLGKSLIELTVAVKAGRELAMLYVIQADDALDRLKFAESADPMKWLGTRRNGDKL